MDDRSTGAAPIEPSADAAVFEAVRVRSGRMPVVAALALAVAGVVGAGVLGRGSPADEGPARDAARVAGVPTAPAPAVRVPAASGTVSMLELDTRTSGRLVLVHGEVLTVDAVVVIVSVVDAADALIGIQTVDMPGGSTAFRTGANDRFDLAFRLADARAPAWVEANAYDRIGRRLATARAPVQVPFEPMRSRFGAGT